MNVHQALGEVLRQERTQAMFAVMGDGNMRLLAELTERTGIPVLFARHEAAAVAMADGHARVTRRIGVCSVTSGPGLALTALPLLTAARRGTPMVLIAGDTALGETSKAQSMDQPRYVHGVGLEVVQLTRPDRAVAALRRAFDLAWSRSEPVVFNAPIDIQDQEFHGVVEPRPDPLHAPMGWTPDILPSPAALAFAAGLIEAAESPIILAGRGAVEDDAGPAIEQLSDVIDAPLFTTLPAKGLFGSGSRRHRGIAGLFASPEGERVMAEADLVVVFGASLNSRTTVGGSLFARARIVRIDRRAPSSSAPEDAYLQAGARVTAEALASALANGTTKSHRLPPDAELAPTIAAEVPAIVDGRLHPRFVMRAADAAISTDATIVIGVGHYFSFAVEELRAADRRFIFTHDFGAIGQGLPMALGASVATGRRVILIEGDASLIMCAQELDTAARYGLPVSVVVMNDEAIGAEYHKLRAHGLDPATSLIRSPNLAAVATGFGTPGMTARTEDEVRSGLAAIEPPSGPYLMDARISREIVSETYRKQYFR